MLLSVVVTLVDGGDALVRCLDALTTQTGDPPRLEIIVPCDDTCRDMDAFRARYPGVTFPDLGHVATTSPPLGPAGQHELFDRRRAAGLAIARGDLIAILEDRGVPRPDWAAEAARLHQASADLVIGGAIENGRDRVLNWAVYFCDFGRYQLPFPAGPRDYVSDVNVCYKRAAIEITQPLWRERYHEPVVHDALVRRGERLMIAPSLIVDQHRDGLRVLPLLAERRAWGRLFASLRVRDAAASRRAVWALTAPLLPVVLFVRHARMQAGKRVRVARFLAASPLVFVLLVAWSLGELQGYLTGTAASAR